MNVMMVSPFSINTPHFETELEIIQRHLDQNDTVVLLGCNADMMACDVNPAHNIPRCLQCIQRRKKGVKLLSQRITEKPILFLKDPDRKELKEFKPNLSDLSHIKEQFVDNFDIGTAALSSVISQIRNPKPDTDKWAKLIYLFMLSSLAFYRSILNHLLEMKIDRVYAYNGRYASLRAVFRACQKANTDIYITERGGTLDHYATFKNTIPHDIDYRLHLMRSKWENESDLNKREETSTKFFIERSNNIVPNWIAFTKDQKKDLLPEKWDPSKKNIAIFITSEDEMAAIGDAWQNPLYRDQMDGITQIVESLRDDETVRIYLRVHPNLKNIRTSQTEKLYSLAAPNLVVIRPESEISSYALMQNSSKIITFGSTIGIEAVYWGIPSILAGQSLYRKLGGTYQPSTHAELMDMVYGNLKPMDKTPALIYGFFEKTFGTPFKYYNSHGILKGTFKGITLKRSKFLQGLQALSLLLYPLGRFSSYLDRLRLKKKYT
jgi:hypothetical protein